MHRNFILFNLFAFLFHSCYATMHHFWFHIAGECKHISVRLNSFVQILGCLSIPSAFVWSYLADRTKWHTRIIAINALFYVIASIINFNLRNMTNRYAVQCGCVLAILLRQISAGGTFSIFFALLLNYVKRTNSSNRNVGTAKMFGILGITFVMMMLGLSGYLFPSTNARNVALVICVLFGTFSAVLAFFSLPEFVKPEAVLFKRKISLKDLFKRVYQYMNLIVLAFFLTTVLIGLNRIALDNFSTSFYHLLGYEMHHIRLFFCFRMIIEAFALFHSDRLCKFIGLYNLFLLSAVFTVLRTFILTMFDLLRASKYRKIFLVCVVEAFKGVSTSAYFYSSTLIFRSFAKYDTQTLAQGLNGCAYNGVPSVLFSIISVFVTNPQSSKHSDVITVNEKMQYDYFLVFFQIVTVLSFFGIIITAVGIYLVKKNKLENFEWTAHK
ncbi:Major Facilitator Superfamily (MFS) [Trachipleistophora hominis]|uniref:Major Facilitator Superfamily (MFS) n=1 Tax=Trachipleistophora hominis TaxID=72359 RepID=L7JT12_TRAHO|nr:Major Facilitator Superfamily (MFS) [Trachipleistophora hominis]